MSARDDDLRAALDLVSMRRESPPLANGFAVATGELLRLVGWRPAVADDGAIVWRPPTDRSNVHATFRPWNGGFADLHAGDLRERHIDAWQLFGRLVELAATGIGVVPEPTRAARRMAARALAASAGVPFDDASIADCIDDLEVMGQFWQLIADRAALARQSSMVARSGEYD
ncbi:hypothetical protein [Burkholderia multivorans]|uniref:hypothetical protein n=1 Tax=Burkholderia multivorans TaxID=87883 RepID=UPI00201996A2|nr:hypothetical protein [Burkholderia multivorans]MCO1381790.1 hypothetical protein [Burkholderia multivorans]MCO1401930.1 hypothetical protein [Burkholderia multivorans]UQO76362.1 hypothetical protein L0Z12_11115 [Burkholderia multivorans]